MNPLRTLTLIALATSVQGCAFDPPAASPTLPIGSACSGDAECASAICEASACVECRSAASCPDHRACDPNTGRCLAADEHRHAPSIGGLRRINAEGRIHVGRVAVTPVSTVVER